MLTGAKIGEKVLLISLAETEEELREVSHSHGTHGWNLDSIDIFNLLADRAGNNKDLTLQSLAHRVVELQKYSPLFGKSRRKIQVVKMRGVDFKAGFHDFNLTRGGIEIYPRMTTAAHKSVFKKETCSSGVKELDSMLDGGIDRGTTTLIMGPGGSGKSSLSALYAVNAAERGEKAVVFTFDEGIETLLTRTHELKMDLTPFNNSGMMELH